MHVNAFVYIHWRILMRTHLTSSQGHLRLRASTEPMRISWTGACSIPEYRVSCIEHSEDLEDETTLHMWEQSQSVYVFQWIRRTLMTTRICTTSNIKQTMFNGHCTVAAGANQIIERWPRLMEKLRGFGSLNHATELLIAHGRWKGEIWGTRLRWGSTKMEVHTTPQLVSGLGHQRHVLVVFASLYRRYMIQWCFKSERSWRQTSLQYL